MRLILCLSLALGLALADKDKGHGHAHGKANHAHGPDHHDHKLHEAEFDRCKGVEMDAVTVNEEGVPYFFKADHMYKGFHGGAELANGTFAEMDDDHHLGHVDAAFHMQHEGHPDDDHIYFFLDNKVFSYYQHKLVEGFPKDISEVFPGIPSDHLDAAVECPKPECEEDSVIFFKGDDIYHYNIKAKTADKKEFASMPNCTSAFRFMEHYFCFHGTHFSRFDPKTGEVNGKYPKNVQGYFVRCANFAADDDDVERERCSRVHLDAITSDHDGDTYAFRDHHFIQKIAGNDTLVVDDIEHAFKEVHSDVDDAFSYDNHIYLIKDDQVQAYKDTAPHTHVDGYPKTVKEELGMEGHIDAAFVCDDNHVVHVIHGDKICDVDLKVTPRAATNERPLALFKKVDTVMCGPTGVKVVVGNHFYQFESVMAMVAAKALPQQHRVSTELFGCDH